MNHTDDNPTAPTVKRPVEMTATAIFLGIILSVVMGAANVYLGLKAGCLIYVLSVSGTKRHDKDSDFGY